MEAPLETQLEWVPGSGRKIVEVIIGGRRRIIFHKRKADVAELNSIIVQYTPDIVAIDSPPAWAKRGNCRQAERELGTLGIQSFATPSDPDKQASSFYDWMREGFRVFRAVTRKFPRYRTGRARGTAIEMFPHATSVFLAARKRPRDIKKHRWRMAILVREGINPASLESKDQVDAALAALTGLCALRGRMQTFGRPDEGVIIVPQKRKPARRGLLSD